MKNIYCLSDIRPGESVRVKELVATGSMRRRFLDIGLVKDTRVECLAKSPAGDPGAYLIRGAVIAIRDQDCQGILVY
ncbi:FeoA family protein [Lacrimispora sp. 210928-DFI.3.58]|uniref:FeoA family protein n=1 Tax=Lacrimispora sp. 210928-DFI.3.58 TaxID=2883214 RepID=UPI0015B5E839|nr:FeoA family protein [Lacrimispora sp. 210928-DFI.3.58]MCB7318375.1 ferrous iron transport protein A [Lacrimispora sp. 210928-DFI.3.58]